MPSLRRLLLTALLMTYCHGVANGEQRFGPLTLSGTLQSQNIVRHPDIDEYHFIQQRNTIRLRARWSLIRERKLLDRIDVPDIASVELRLLYRGVYDSIYDYTPTLRERDLRGRKPGRAALRDLGDLSQQARDALKFENDLREAYADVAFATWPLQLRIGKQQIVWGEADLFRMLDRINPLDLSWHSAEEIPPPSFGWDELRIPLWMLLARYTVGTIGPFEDASIEAYWNPGDWRPMKVSFLPRPWGIRLLDPLTNREDGAFFSYPGVHRLWRSSLFKQGSYDRNPFENSQIGLRVGATLPGGVRLSVYYFYQRWAGDDGTPTAPVRGIPNDPNGQVRTAALLARGTLPVEYIAPHIHTIGLSGSWFSPAVRTVFRLETVYDFGLRMLDRNRTTTFAPMLPGIVKRDYWKGMLAFDRAFTVPTLNRDSAIFLTGQWFLHHIIHNKDSLTGPIDLPTVGSRPRPFCGSAPTEPCTDPTGHGSFRDDIRSWESLVTMAAFTTYRDGTLAPVLGVVLDPVNSYNLSVFWNLNWVVSGISLDLSQRYFIGGQDDVQKGPFSPWGLGGMRGRSETSLRFTWEF